MLMPSYVTVNLNGADGKSLQIQNICLKCLQDKDNCKRPHSWIFSVSEIRGVSLYKADQRCLFLYVHHNSDDFQMFFPSQELRTCFYNLIMEMTADEEGITDLDSIGDSGPIQVLSNQSNRFLKQLFRKPIYSSNTKWMNRTVE